MTKSIMEMVQELVLSQSEQRIMNADELDQLIMRIYNSFKKIQNMEFGGETPENIINSPQEQSVTSFEPSEAREEEPASEPKIDPKESIQDEKIVCIECGQPFKTLTHTHLKEHGLTSEEYKQKWGIRGSLAAKSVSDRRKALAKERNLGETLKMAREKARSEKS